MAWAMYYVSVLRAVVCMLVACLYLCQAQFFGDTVLLTNLRVNSQGMVDVDITVEVTKKANRTVQVPGDHLEVVLRYQNESRSLLVSGNELEQEDRKVIISYSLTGLNQDRKYDLHLQANNTIISDTYTLGLQSITVVPGLREADITCEFLPGSRADGCLLEWGLINTTNTTSMMVARPEGETSVSAQLQGLTPGLAYQFCGFGLEDNRKLHQFPIKSQAGAITLPTEPSKDELSVMTEFNEPISLMVLVTILCIVLALLMVMIIVLISCIVAVIKCPKKTRRGRGMEDMEQHMTGEEGTDIIETAPNLCYEQGRYTSHGRLDDSLHVYDDILALNQPVRPSVDGGNALHIYDNLLPLEPLSHSAVDYENVDLPTGLPTVPRPHISELSSVSLDECRRACLPLKAVEPSVARPKRQVRACTLKCDQRENPQGAMLRNASCFELSRPH